MGYFSNGSSADYFYEHHCSKCVHDEEYRRTEKNPCQVWNAHILYSYELCNEDESKNPGKHMLDMLILKGEESCAMFVPVNRLKRRATPDETRNGRGR